LISTHVTARRARRVPRSALCLLLFVAATTIPSAQIPAATAAETTVTRIRLTAGRSTVLTSPFAIRRVAITNPAVAEATAIDTREVLLDGKGVGTVSLILWGEGQRVQYDIVVEPPVPALQQQLQQLFPGEDVQVDANDQAVVLSGRVSSNEIALRAAEIAQSSGKDRKIINLLQLPGGSDSQQVLLQVRFAEVDRRALIELGVSLFTGPSGYKDFVGRSSTQQFAAPDFEGTLGIPRPGDPPGKMTFSDFLNLFVFNTKYNIGAAIRALQSKGYFQSLAEPNLIAYNGQEASFLAGGEIPIPIVQGISGAVSVVFKEFGVRLRFRPTVAGDTIRLRVAPEVSTLDFPNGITLQGFRIPALSTRRAETDVELHDGQSFAIAGLMNNLSQEDRASVPGLGAVPIIGALFRSKARRAEQTELMVLITPHLVRPLNPDEVPSLPTNPKGFLPPELGDQFEGGRGTIDAPPVPPVTPKPAAKPKAARK
jgi:pilus assembly protein CpaC